MESGILRHIYELRFSFLSAFCPQSALKLAKSANKRKKFSSSKIRHGYQKMPNSMPSSNPLEKMQEKKVLGRKPRSNKSQKINFSDTFSPESFSTESKSA